MFLRLCARLRGQINRTVEPVGPAPPVRVAPQPAVLTLPPYTGRMPHATAPAPAPEHLPRFLPAPTARDHKYTRGVLTVATGSAQFPGAALIGTKAAARVGIGMVRYVGAESVGRLVLARTPEVVLGEGRSQAVVAGSGWAVPADGAAAPEGPAAPDGFETVLEASGRIPRPGEASKPRPLPLVLDAGAIPAIVGDDRVGDWATVLTPHAGEAADLLSALLDAGTITMEQLTGAGLSPVCAGAGPGDTAPGDSRPDRTAADGTDTAPITVPRAEVESEPQAAAALLAEATGSTVVLKGHTTHIATPEHDGPMDSAFTVTAPTTRLATAGSGDVLAAIIGALLALNAAEIQEARAYFAPAAQEIIAMIAAAGVELHGLAALRASQALAGGAAPNGAEPNGRADGDAPAELPSAGAPILAADITRFVPQVVAENTRA